MLRFLHGGMLTLLVGHAPLGCRSGSERAPRTAVPSASAEGSAEPGVELVPVACGRDQVREYRCDALLPLSSALPAPEPYGSCPSAIEVADPVFQPLSRLGLFDAPHTELMRRRAPPGQQCCYSWCARLEVKRVADVPPGGRCREPLAFPESTCMPEPEGELSAEHAASPYERCAAAVRPPEGVAFSVPPAALMNPALTRQRRGQGYNDCCYAWCSIAPPGSGLERQRMK